jgi:hypothetical protein
MSEIVEDAPVSAPSRDKGLRSGALSMVSSIVIGMAATAPAYSIAATLGLLVLTGVGV